MHWLLFAYLFLTCFKVQQESWEEHQRPLLRLFARVYQLLSRGRIRVYWLYRHKLQSILYQWDGNEPGRPNQLKLFDDVRIHLTCGLRAETCSVHFAFLDIPACAILLDVDVAVAILEQAWDYPQGRDYPQYYDYYHSDVVHVILSSNRHNLRVCGRIHRLCNYVSIAGDGALEKDEDENYKSASCWGYWHECFRNIDSAESHRATQLTQDQYQRRILAQA